MDELRLAFILLLVVICVCMATRPDPARRSTSARPVSRRASSSGGTKRLLPRPSDLPEKRNRWDRRDLVRSFGAD